MDQMNVSVILPAAGAGTRFAQGSPGPAPSKIELDLNGKPVFLRAAELFTRRHDVGRVILAVAPDGLEDFRFRWGDKLSFMGVTLVAGGETERWQTVAKALQAVDEDATHIAIHDAARPLASDTLIDRVFSAASRFHAVVPACGVGSTLKRVEDHHVQQADADPLDAILGSAGKDTEPVRRVVQTVDRRGLVAAQTPQVFEAKLLCRAYRRIAQGSLDPAGVTDDAQLIEVLGEPVHVVQGESTNLKITYLGDAELAEALIQKRAVSQASQRAEKRLFGDDQDG